MSKGTLGSFNGTTTANANMVDVFREQDNGSFCVYGLESKFARSP